MVVVYLTRVYKLNKIGFYVCINLALVPTVIECKLLFSEYFWQLCTLQVELSIVHKMSNATKAIEATVFMPVTVPRRATKNNEVAICVKATYGHIDHLRLVEWFELHRLLGVSHIGVYATPMLHPYTRRTLAQYAATSLVELRNVSKVADGAYGDRVKRMVSSATMNDCLYRHMYTHKFVGIYDFDEVSRSLLKYIHCILCYFISDLYDCFLQPSDVLFDTVL